MKNQDGAPRPAETPGIDPLRRPSQPLELRIYSEKKPGEGEDADPLLVWFGDRLLLSVFDGMGGAGGRQYPDGNHHRSGAYVASRRARSTVESFFGRQHDLTIEGDSRQQETEDPESTDPSGELTPRDSAEVAKHLPEDPSTEELESLEPKTDGEVPGRKGEGAGNTKEPGTGSPGSSSEGRGDPPREDPLEDPSTGNEAELEEAPGEVDRSDLGGSPRGPVSLPEISDLSESAVVASCVEQLRDRLLESFQSLAEKFGARARSRLKSKLIKPFPTTMACLYAKIESDEIQVVPIWAGDSRGYALGPSQGLQQLTRDELRAEVDPLRNLTEDSPLSNFISADGDFRLASRFQRLPTPCVLIAATDGCFGYWATPMHFEWVLLSTLAESKSMESWRQLLQEEMEAVSADDLTLSLVAVGWTSFDNLRRDFQKRLELRSGFIQRFDAHERTKGLLQDKIDQLQSQTQELQKQLEEHTEKDPRRDWEEYKRSYMLYERDGETQLP